MRRPLRWLPALLVILADQLVKAFVRRMTGDIVLIPGILRLTHTENTGVAFSLFSSWPAAVTVLTLLLSLGAVILAVYWQRRGDRLGAVGTQLIAGGAVGNCIDRMLFGSVTDMFVTDFFRFSVFNVADICLVVGCGLCILSILLPGKEKAHGE